LASTALTPDLEVEIRQLVLFRLAAGVHAVDLLDVREIIPLRRATRLPSTPPYVMGLINVRGSIITVIDLARRLQGTPVGAGGAIVLVEHDGRTIGVAVDEVLEVRRVRPDEIAPPGPEHAGGGVIAGLGHSRGSIVIVLDIHAIIRHVLP
jgi:purine-binding chemotaxis protein CheW